MTNNEKHFVNQTFGEQDCGINVCDPFDSETIIIGDTNITDINFNLLHGQDFYPDYSGLWYNPEQSGHGLQVEVIKAKGKASLLVTWFALINGEPMWLTGVGPLNRDVAFIDLSITRGALFPPDFNPQDVQREDWGRIRFEYTDLNNAEIIWVSDIQGFSNANLSIQRISHLSHAIKTDNSIDACQSGSYYNQDQSGHGVTLEVIGENAETIVATWLTYKDGEQFWLVATGKIDGNSASLPAIYSSGTEFPPNFDSSNLQTNQWGTLLVTRVDDDNIEFGWIPNATHQAFGSGSLDMSKITRIQNLTGCETNFKTKVYENNTTSYSDIFKKQIK
jgi:hypothetical protein